VTVHLGVEWPDEPGDEAAEARVDGDSLRSWVVTGKRRFTVHPGRKSGANVEARRLLVEDGRPDGADSTWGHLVAALQRQAVHNALAGLRSEDRQVLTLAFLQGHTNGEIASMLNVSARTVGRRLSAALARLEHDVRDAGARLAGLPLAFLSYVDRRSELFSGLAALIRSPQALTTIAAAATVAVVGYATITAPRTAAAPPRSTVQVAKTIRPQAPLTAILAGTPGAVVEASSPVPALAGRVHDGSVEKTLSSTAAPAATTGCHGNPTSAAPATPVRSHGGGSPVSHPGRGGCGPHSA
jgi:RNA polymerase sigma factor (sigma-70 family)